MGELFLKSYRPKQIGGKNTATRAVSHRLCTPVYSTPFSSDGIFVESLWQKLGEVAQDHEVTKWWSVIKSCAPLRLQVVSGTTSGTKKSMGKSCGSAYHLTSKQVEVLSTSATRPYFVIISWKTLSSSPDG